ncbi:LysM peptidoglycan-binding domain-containing protein [Paenibacillus sp. ACRRY]|uniref:LysM peptidoglycan-binding domain-containing protein n=1 Tax=Paenibacillus sp. ACRRY TaxID=2918208 RepID=UPI001EF55D3E|nr:LysM peptidoglycan-binding domain-containing protein [Paenibacillus sp. ACRRY]MCG7385110.1 LysM peptidoglycan-binding domain-containing protein [Paenibacillus sp. ACRRY]
MSREIWLSYNNNAERLRLPVNPPEISIGNGSQTTTVDVAGIGEVAIINDPVLKTFEFSSFFPSTWGPYCEYKDIPIPKQAAATISKWKATGKPIRFLVSGTAWNFAVTIEDFVYREEGGDVETIHFDLNLREYKFVTIRKLDEKKTAANGSKKVTTSTTAARPSTKTVPATYKVKSGDSLWKIAKANNTTWQKLAEINKIKAPYTIRPGQELKLK